jgi:large subunit ribosomal protein L24
MSALKKAATSGSGKMRIKKGDQVIVLSGKDKGKTGTVTQAMPKDAKVIVGGVNIATRHTKPSQGDPQGGLQKFEAPLHVSKVAHVTADGKPTRVRYETQDGKKVRVAVKTGEKIGG